MRHTEFFIPSPADMRTYPATSSERESASLSPWLHHPPLTPKAGQNTHKQRRMQTQKQAILLSMYSRRKEGFQVTHDLARGSGAAARKQMPLGSQDQVSHPRPLDSQLLSSPQHLQLAKQGCFMAHCLYDLTVSPKQG